MNKNLLVLPGDGVGPEIMTEALKVLTAVNDKFSLGFTWSTGLIGGAAIDATGVPLPAETLVAAKAAGAVLLGAVGGPKWDALPMDKRPEKGLLGIRSELDLFANLRPAVLYPQLADASTLKPEVVSGLDLLIVRELTGGIYFGQPRGIRDNDGVRQGYNTYVYDENEIRRIGRVAFEAARVRSGRLCSVDKANVLEVTVLWREIMTELAANIQMSH